MKEMLLGVHAASGSQSPFLGEVPASQFITGSALASAIGLTVGIVQNSNEPWLHFELDGKTLYVAKKAFRNTVTWDQIHARGAVYGTATVQIQGDTYKVRLLKGAASDPISGGSGQHDPEQSWGSEWNRLMYPLIPNPTNTPTHPISQEGIRYGEWANYTETDLNIGTGGGMVTWCQESSGSSRVRRGDSGLSYFSLISSSYTNGFFGWRPVLELIP